jgi:Glycosyl hydrolase family 10
MGVMTFLLPDGISAEARRELERAAIAGGPDNMPTPTDVTLGGGQLRTRRSVDESGYLVAPWEIDSVGRVMGTTATLMERARPYTLITELARGKVNQMRCQAADWRMGGLQITAPLQQAIQDATLNFGKAVTGATGNKPTAAETQQAQQALALGYRAAQQLVEAYIDQVFAIRHQRAARLDTAFGARVQPAADGLPDFLKSGAIPYARAFNSITIAFPWCAIEAEEGSYSWRGYDELVDWALAQGLQISGGPLIEFSSVQLPAWLWLWERDVPSMASFMCKAVEATVRRYRQKIRRWQISAGTNCARVLGLGEEELLGLTYRLAEAARQVDPAIELILGVSQPWGEYMATQDYSHSPFIFADTLIRSGLNNLAALDVDLVMGVSPRGSYCRDVLEASRLLDLYALLGVPLRVTLGYPASESADATADPEVQINAGRWRGGFAPPIQAEWAAAFAALALCKPFVQSVQWVHLSDAQAHQVPHAGLVDAKGHVRPAFERLQRLREQHLR